MMMMMMLTASMQAQIDAHYDFDLWPQTRDLSTS